MNWLAFLPRLRIGVWPDGLLDAYIAMIPKTDGDATPRSSSLSSTGRPISVSAVPFGPGIDIWRSCRFIGAMMRCLCLLIGADHCLLRHVGWEKCGHGLASRPRESASKLLLDELLGLFRYPPRCGRALLAGTLPLRYCAARFAYRTPT